MKNSMPKLSLIICWFVIVNHSAYSQSHSIEALSGLPKNLVLIETSPQRYYITTEYFNGDMFGNFLNRTQVTGEYTRGFSNNKVKWNNVRIAHSNSRNDTSLTGTILEYMEDFTYVPGDHMMRASSFHTFPETPTSIMAKNLVWDMMGIEFFAWTYFDSLKLNQSFKPTSVNGPIDLADAGTFENKDVQLKWLGLSLVNDELCALIEYRTFDNPLKMDMKHIEIRGRSHYWGTIWISLRDKQIEYAVLYEDVILDMKIDPEEARQFLNTTREITFEKINN